MSGAYSTHLKMTNDKINMKRKDRAGIKQMRDKRFIQNFEHNTTEYRER